MRNYSQVFAVGDIHGCKELLNDIHNKIIEASKNKGMEILKAPALIVKTLNGIGVNPAVKVMTRP